MSLKMLIKKSIKSVLPYGVLAIYRKIKNKYDGLYYQCGIDVLTKEKEPQLKQWDIHYFKKSEPRLSIDEMCKALEPYDVISFDIFDTALYRKVENPNDVFAIMTVEMGYNDFVNARQKAATNAKNLKETSSLTREIFLSDIYDVLEKNYGIDRRWMNREIEIEMNVAQANPYILEVYRRVLDMGKEVIFVADTYLQQEIIAEILKKTGYTAYSKIYLSSETKLLKSDGTLQKLMLSEYKGRQIVHIGDQQDKDIESSINAGIDAIYNPDSRASFKEPDMDSLSGSFYRSIVNTQINSGIWDKNLYYEHGFRIGGILTAGFCEYINTVAEQKGIDKILFCARDCEIVWKVYNQFYKKYENEYMQISRSAILNVTSERYLYDLANRFIFRYIDRYKNEKTIETILTESGYAYLTDYLEDDHIDKFMFPCSIDMKKIELFIFNHQNIIIEHNASMVNAAKSYFSSLLGNARNILVVDIGWSGTCITAFKYFVETHYKEKYQVSGVLMCTSRNAAVTSSIENGNISAYIYSPFKNMDITRFMMPGGRKLSVKELDMLHMPLEFLFTSSVTALVGYIELEDKSIGFQRYECGPHNADEIQEMQSGLIDFIKIYKDNTTPYENMFTISPYVAFNPLKEATTRQEYIKAVYKNFTYDAMTAPFEPVNNISYFGKLFEDSISNQLVLDTSNDKKQILFVSPDLVYVGAPRSLLRMCRAAIMLGYQPVVWSMKAGPFASEYVALGINVHIVPESDLQKHEVIRQIKTFDMAVCNTIVTDCFASECSKHIPTIWYIREASNIPGYIRNNLRRQYTLKHSKDIYCVSQYAAKAIRQFTKNKVRVIHNCVEDEVEMAVQYRTGSADKVRFVQFGTIEYRKGYDVLLAAFKSMPEKYRQSSELFFAGGFINSGAPFCSYLFNQMKDEPNVHYLGLIQGEEKKISTLSTMDVVVVASRDESCSLVALEGAMLSKPLIVTENVGAKYMVGKKNGINGFVVKTADVDSLKTAMMQLIDKKNDLASMGRISREYYEKNASFDSYIRDMKKLYSRTEKKKSPRFFFRIVRNEIRNSNFAINHDKKREQRKRAKLRKEKENVILSLTSHPGRIDTVALCIETLVNQTSMPQKILLWLSKDQFPQLEKDLPEALIELERNNLIFKICWVENDIAPHKKYFYAMQEYTDIPVIIVDDDVFYDCTLVEKLMKSYRNFPDCISCMRANLITFKDQHNLRAYKGWLMGYTMLQDTPSYHLLPTGVGGVLYPPKSLPKQAFDYQAIMDTCLYCDDLWLKVFSSHNGYRAVVPSGFCIPKIIPGTEEASLWKINVVNCNNDTSMKNILDFYDKNIGNSAEYLQMIWKDRFC